MTLQMGAVCRAIAGQPSGQPKESLNAAARKTLNGISNHLSSRRT